MDVLFHHCGDGSSSTPIAIQRVALRERQALHRFRGETKASCELPDGPVRDLNLITDRSRVEVEVCVHSLSSIRHVRTENAIRTELQPAHQVMLVFVVTGRIRISVCAGESLSYCCGLGLRDTLRVDRVNTSNKADVLLEAEDGAESLVFVAHLTMLPTKHDM